MKKFYCFTIFLILYAIPLVSQYYKRIENIELLVWNTFKHEIINDSITKTKYSINQKTFDPNNLLILERIFDENTHNQIFHITYFYDSLKRLKSVEKFNSINNKPFELMQIFYKNNKSDTSKIIYYCADVEKIEPCKEKIFEYNNDNLYLKKTIDLKSKKVLEVEKYIYLKNGNLLKIKGNVNYPIKQKYEIAYEYNNDNTINRTKFQNKSEKIITYYNSKNKPSKIEYYENNNLKKVIIYNYEGDIELKSILEYDKNKNLQKYYSIDYYYHKITSLNLKSYFENNLTN